MARQINSKSSKSQSHIRKILKNKKSAFVGKRPQITLIPGTVKHVAGQSIPPSNFATVFRDGFGSGDISNVNINANRFSSSSINTYSSDDTKFMALSSPTQMCDIPLSDVNELRYCAPCDFDRFKKARIQNSNSKGHSGTISNPGPKKSFTRWIILLWKQFTLKIRRVFIREKVSSPLPDGFQFVKPQVGSGIRSANWNGNEHNSTHTTIIPHIPTIPSLTVPAATLNPLTHSRSRSCTDVRGTLNTPEPRIQPKREARYYGNGYGNEFESVEDRRWTWGLQYVESGRPGSGNGAGLGVQNQSFC